MLTAAQVAERLGVSRRLVYDLAARGVLPSYRFEGAVRFEPADVEAYIQASKVVRPSRLEIPVTPGPKLNVREPGEESELAQFFRSAGVKPKLAPSTSRPRKKKP
jgi:excisionase family DNA binding protein